MRPFGRILPVDRLRDVDGNLLLGCEILGFIGCTVRAWPEAEEPVVLPFVTQG